MLCGIGFDAQVAHDFSKQKNRGLSSYIKQTVKNFFSAKPFIFSIDLNGMQLHMNAFFISIANSNQFGNKVTIAPKASLNDGMLDIVVVNKMNKIWMVLSLLHHIKFGGLQQALEKGFENKAILYFQTKKIIIHNHSFAPLHIDGEPAQTEKLFEIKIIEKAFMLLQP
jgi:diacylglycerol kinase family enzyme